MEAVSTVAASAAVAPSVAVAGALAVPVARVVGTTRAKLGDNGSVAGRKRNIVYHISKLGKSERAVKDEHVTQLALEEIIPGTLAYKVVFARLQRPHCDILRRGSERTVPVDGCAGLILHDRHVRPSVQREPDGISHLEVPNTGESIVGLEVHRVLRSGKVGKATPIDSEVKYVVPCEAPVADVDEAHKILVAGCANPHSDRELWTTNLRSLLQLQCICDGPEDLGASDYARGR